MWIRWKKWKHSHTGIRIADPRQDCFFSNKDDGCLDIQYKQTVEALLRHPHEFEIAIEKYGVTWDATGREVSTLTSPQDTEPHAIPVPASTEVSAPLKRGPGRPPKR